MSKLEKYYQVMPENFNDDLADSLMKAFESLESVDVKDEIPTLQHELWQRGYLIAPRPEQVIERKEMWFVKFYVSDSGIEREEVHNFYEQVCKYDHTVIENPLDFFHKIQNILFEIPNLKIEISFDGLVVHSCAIGIDYSAIKISCYRVK